MSFSNFKHYISRTYPLCLFFYLTIGCICGQKTNLATPLTLNYLNETYLAGTQNWDIEQHPNGFLFFANNDGLLQYNGTNWHLFPLPNKTIVRSLHISEDGRIYVGGQGEFGYFEPDSIGHLHYNSLLGLIPNEYVYFTDVWKITSFKGDIYFNASDKVYRHTKEKIQVYQHGEIKFLGQAINRLFVNNELGLFEIINENIVRVPRGELLTGKTVTDLAYGKKGQLIFSTYFDGLYVLSMNSLKPMQVSGTRPLLRFKIFCITEINDDLLAIGTVKNGLIIMDKSGKLLNQLSKKNGLQNNNIISILSDRDENLWLGLDNGIDYVATSSPFNKLLVDKDQEAMSYTARITDGMIYVGTSSGLYQLKWQDYYDPLDDNDFQLLKGSDGQVWGLSEIGEDLILGHHEGAFLIRNNRLERLSLSNGAWTFLQLKNNPDYMLSGTYAGLELFKKEDGSWRFIHKYPNLTESSRIIEQDHSGNIWVAHPYRGIYKIKLSEDLTRIDVKFYGEKDGLPNDHFNHVCQINEEIIFTGETGTFRYHSTIDSFLHDEPLESLVGRDQSIQRLFEDQKDNIWFVTSTETGLLKRQIVGNSVSFTKKIYPELHRKLVRGFEFIYPFDEYNVLIGSERGMIHFNPSKSQSKEVRPISANIVSVQSIKNRDSTLFYGQFEGTNFSNEETFPYHVNAFRFSYTTPNYAIKIHTEYATKLEGFDKDWSEWSDKTEKEYTNLKPGSYRFLVRSRSGHNVISPMASYSFSIGSPWYASAQAILFYIISGLLVLLAIIFIPQKKFKKEKAKQQEVITKSEEEIDTLKNQQLEIQIAHKNKELATTTMHLVQRKELLLKLKEPLGEILKRTSDTMAIKEIKRIKKLLDLDNELDDAWDQFAFHFDQVHIDFLKKIQLIHPELTATDQKFCAYLRMNLTTKEIAPLMNISIRGVETGRYRLRKKLGLDSSVDLNEFMISF